VRTAAALALDTVLIAVFAAIGRRNHAETGALADVLATAIISGGRESLDDSCARFSIDVLAIDASGEMLATPGFRAALAEA